MIDPKRANPETVGCRGCIENKGKSVNDSQVPHSEARLSGNQYFCKECYNEITR